MSPRSSQKSSRRHIWVYDEDWKFLEKMFGPATESRLGVGPTIRQIVHLYVNNLRQQEQAKIDAAAKRQGAKA